MSCPLSINLWDDCGCGKKRCGKPSTYTSLAILQSEAAKGRSIRPEWIQGLQGGNTHARQGASGRFDGRDLRRSGIGNLGMQETEHGGYEARYNMEQYGEQQSASSRVQPVSGSNGLGPPLLRTCYKSLSRRCVGCRI